MSVVLFCDDVGFPIFLFFFLVTSQSGAAESQKKKKERRPRSTWIRRGVTVLIGPAGSQVRVFFVFFFPGVMAPKRRCETTSEASLLNTALCFHIM